MHPGRYFYLVFLITVALLGGAVFTAMTADIIIAILNDTDPTYNKSGWSYLFVTIGLASILTSIISTAKD